MWSSAGGHVEEEKPHGFNDFLLITDQAHSSRMTAGFLWDLPQRWQAKSGTPTFSFWERRPKYPAQGQFHLHPDFTPTLQKFTSHSHLHMHEAPKLKSGPKLCISCDGNTSHYTRFLWPRIFQETQYVCEDECTRTAWPPFLQWRKPECLGVQRYGNGCIIMICLCHLLQSFKIIDPDKCLMTWEMFTE